MATARVGQVRPFSLSTRIMKFVILWSIFMCVKCANDWDSNTSKGTNINIKKLFSEDGYFTDTSQDEVKPFNGIDIQVEAQKLSANLRWLSNEEIGVTKMQMIYDSLPYTDVSPYYKTTLREIAERIHQRFKNYLQIVQTNKIIVQNLYKFHIKEPITQKFDCCHFNSSDLRPDSEYRCKISKQTSCDLIPYTVPDGAFNPGRNLTEVWKTNMNFFPTLKWQYFISTEGIHNEYPGSAFQWSNCPSVHDIRHRDVYVSTMQPQSKRIVIMMDHGNSLSATQMHMARSIAKNLIASFTENDRISVIGLSSDVTFPRDDSCVRNSLVPVTFESKFFFTRFIDNLEKQDASTNHSLGFQQAFKIIGSSLQQPSKADGMIIYISRGLLSSLAEAQVVMSTIAYYNGKMDNRIIINTYAVIDCNKPIMYEKSFLQDIANQNYSKYTVSPGSKSPIRRGMMIAVNNTRDLSMTVGRFYIPFNKTAAEVPVFSLPYIDNADGALTMSISMPCLHNKLPIGMSGVDLHMEDIVQDITYFNRADNCYAFMINVNGYTIMHPSFTRPIKTNLQPMHTDIWHFENVAGFEDVRINMLRRNEGEQSMYVKETTNSSGVLTTHNVFYAKYIWKKIDGTPFIVAIKILQKQDTVKHLNNHVSLPDLVYHRVDILPTNKMCLHLKQLATTDSSTVFLSANSFINPFEHLNQGVNKRMVQSYLAYLKDGTRLINNPGLKTTVRNDVAATAGIDNLWKHRFKVSEWKDYIVRRYVTTPSGVFRSYPGALFDETYDPTKQFWYERAMKYPGQVTLTAPYLDVGGAGYIATISHTIYEGQAQSLHSSSDKIVAVMGMDVTLGYFYKMLLDHISVCKMTGVRCFLINDDGYMIAHPSLVEPDGRGPVEEQHITHKEPLVANDILNHRHFVHKKLCNRYNDRTIQRFYTFNTSLEGVLTNLVHGEHCARYQIVSVPGTNIFLGMINHTCDLATAFCPCSMLDRLCLNCNRMGQVECECPCECPLAMDFCNGDLLKSEDMNPSCPRFPEKEEIPRLDPDITNSLTQCNTVRCESKTTQMDCLGVLGCEWCQVKSSDSYDEDGMEIHKPLAHPFCGSQVTCFGGVVGARNPYGDRAVLPMDGDDEAGTKSAPVGPVAGGIMGCFLMLALGVYCYRHRVHRNSLQYISTLPENQNRHSQFYETEDADQIEEHANGHTNFVLATFENPASISPYRVNTSYRRPAGGDSDHGYSTMTPHDDSEHASLPCLEPLIVGKDRYKPGISSSKTPTIPPPPSVASRRSRSPTPPQTRLSGYQPIFEQVDPSQTVIDGPPTNNPHSVLANVQVHMVDTH
ncbi:VWFA and cache domain-containing protein 1 [Mactra antiquata]